MKFVERAAIAAMEALIVAETWTPPGSGGIPTRPSSKTLAAEAWDYAKALDDYRQDEMGRTP